MYYSTSQRLVTQLIFEGSALDLQGQDINAQVSPFLDLTPIQPLFPSQFPRALYKRSVPLT